MNSNRQAGATALKSVRDRIAAWRLLLERCGAKATRKRVHALRVVTLRLQAELDRDLADLPRASHQAQAILRFLKRAEKLRQALSPVRAIDVWIGKLRGLRGSLADTGDYVPRSMQASIRSIDRLEKRLKKKRSEAEKKLVAEIGERGGHLVRAGKDVEEGLSDYLFSEEPEIARELVERFRLVKADFSTFNEENLHDFRKRIKAVRYLAEIHANADKVCARIASQMKKMQSAIGEWHDWQELCGEARGHGVKSKGLAELLDTVTRETFDVALSTVHVVAATLLGEDAGKADELHAEDKLPARGDLVEPEMLGKKLA